MTDANDRMQAAISAMKYLVVMFPGADLPPETFEARCVLLSELEPAQLKQAVEMCAKVCKFFPTIAEIFDAARDIAGESLPSAGEAWDWVLERASGNLRPDPPHPVAALALEAIGGCEGWEIKDRDWHRKEYMKAYDSLVRQELVRAPSGPALPEPDPTPRLTTGSVVGPVSREPGDEGHDPYRCPPECAQKLFELGLIRKESPLFGNGGMG